MTTAGSRKKRERGPDGRFLSGDCERDCQKACAYPGRFSECAQDASEQPLDVCMCGDYRWQHDSRHGACSVCVTRRGPWDNCTGFRLNPISDVSDY